MNKMKIVKPKGLSHYDSSFRESAVVLEGFDINCLPEYMNYLKSITEVYKERAFVIKGRLINDSYRLGGENRYPENLNIIAILQEDVRLDKDTVQKLYELGAKPYTDVIYNNNRMEIRRRAKEALSSYKSPTSNDIVFNSTKRDQKLEYLLKMKPGTAVSPLGPSLLQTGTVRTKDEDIEKVYVNDKKTLDRLYEEWALTIEGMPFWHLPFYMDFLESRTKIYRKRVHIITGETMNKAYGLTGWNAYLDDACLVSISKEDVDQDGIAITLDRNLVWAKFFNDIVDNNLIQERGYTKEEELEMELLYRNSSGIFYE